MSDGWAIHYGAGLKCFTFDEGRAPHLATSLHGTIHPMSYDMETLDLRLDRLECGRKVTIGELSINGEFECFSLEDQLRAPGVKVPAQTCIPAGKYRVLLTMSNRFKRVLPLLEAVPMFEGIRIHPGNTSEDTEGCILVGMDRMGQTIGRSRLAFDALFDKLLEADQQGIPIWITIDNGDQTPPEEI